MATALVTTTAGRRPQRVRIGSPHLAEESAGQWIQGHLVITVTWQSYHSPRSTPNDSPLRDKTGRE